MQQTLPRRLARKEEELLRAGMGGLGIKSFLKKIGYVNTYGKDPVDN